jgi:hypothetical protein
MGACVIILEEHTKLDCKGFWWALFSKTDNLIGFVYHGMDYLEDMCSSKLINYGNLNIHLIQPT